jgi:ribosomal protein L16/L10AE
MGGGRVRALGGDGLGKGKGKGNFWMARVSRTLYN